METKERKAKILDRHMKIKTLDELADCLEEYFEKPENAKYGFFIDTVNDDMILGMIGGAFFNITYEYGKRAAILVDMESPASLQILERLIEPTMWYIDPASVAPVKYSAPLLRYSTPTHNVVEWETFDPASKLKSVAFEVFTNKTTCTNIQVSHPIYKLEDFRESTYFGNMDGYVPAEIQEQIENFTQFELYYNIKQLYELYNYYEKLEAKLDQTNEEAQERIMYNIDYLLQRTEKFGVKAFKPSPKPYNLTQEQMAWFTWWDEAFTKLVEERPWTLQEWKKFPKGFDPSFKPEGSYRDYLVWVPEEQNK
ncbi:MAG: hypothetical protein IKC11_04415 [Clostridia bacterium]|nr:hypothetical protein [Clostridia bacterium]